MWTRILHSKIRQCEKSCENQNFHFPYEKVVTSSSIKTWNTIICSENWAKLWTRHNTKNTFIEKITKTKHWQFKSFLKKSTTTSRDSVMQRGGERIAAQSCQAPPIHSHLRHFREVIERTSKISSSRHKDALTEWFSMWWLRELP
jgi:hypothetical protein